MSALMDEVTRRWGEVFTQLASGDDVPPSQRLRLEGLMEALAITGECAPDEIQAAMAEHYQAVFGHGIEHAVGEDWSSLCPFPQIPAFMQRAPVYPSTSD